MRRHSSPFHFYGLLFLLKTQGKGPWSNSENGAHTETTSAVQFPMREALPRFPVRGGLNGTPMHLPSGSAFFCVGGCGFRNRCGPAVAITCTGVNLDLSHVWMSPMGTYTLYQSIVGVLQDTHRLNYGNLFRTGCLCMPRNKQLLCCQPLWLCIGLLFKMNGTTMCHVKWLTIPWVAE